MNKFELKMCCKFSVRDKRKDPGVKPSPSPILYFLSAKAIYLGSRVLLVVCPALPLATWYDGKHQLIAEERSMFTRTKTDNQPKNTAEGKIALLHKYPEENGCQRCMNESIIIYCPYLHYEESFPDVIFPYCCPDTCMIQAKPGHQRQDTYCKNTHS